MNIFPFRVHFTKCGRLRFLSHHDLMRLLERAIRRSGLPIKLTEGFNPRPRISIPLALGVGIESEHELMQIELVSWTSPRQIQTQLNAQLPEGIQVTCVEPFSRRERTRIDSVEYEVYRPEGYSEEEKRMLLDLLTQAEVWVKRGSDKGYKELDIRRYILGLHVYPQRVLLRIKVTDTGTARPDEVLRAAGIELGPDARIRRIKTQLALRE